MSMDNVIDIGARLPHEVCEVMCWKCGKRWYAVFPEATILADLECPVCEAHGYAFKTGQTMPEN